MGNFYKGLNIIHKKFFFKTPNLQYYDDWGFFIYYYIYI